MIISHCYPSELTSNLIRPPCHDQKAKDWVSLPGHNSNMWGRRRNKQQTAAQATALAGHFPRVCDKRPPHQAHVSCCMLLPCMLIFFRAISGMMKISSSSVMNDYKGHSLATGSPQTFCYRTGWLWAWFLICVPPGTVCFCWTRVMHVIESGLPAPLNCGLGLDTKHASLETGCWCGCDLLVVK